MSIEKGKVMLSSGDVLILNMHPVFISGYVDLDETRVTRKITCKKCGTRFYDVLDTCPECGDIRSLSN
jgi:rubrerythrin